VDRREIPAYAYSEAARYLDLPPSTLRAWFAGQKSFRPVIRAADPKRIVLSFSNLVEAYVLAAIRRKHHIGLPTIRRGLRFLTERLGSKRPLLEQQFATSGKQLYVELGHVINISRDGQIEMAELIRTYLERVDRDPKGVPIKLYPFMRAQPLREQARTIVIDPQVSFGRPVIAGTGIPTAVLAEQFEAGDDVRDLAKEYGASEEAISDALRCEFRLKAA
jgi:uncharacterized protein (DUF433 family)